MSEPKQQEKSGKDEILSLFWKLSNPNDGIRIAASEKLIASLLGCQQEYEKSKSKDGERWCSEVRYSLGRLISGLASERKASRLGFSCALTHLLSKLKLADDSTIQLLLSMIEENLKVSKDKSAEKGFLLGKVFAFLGIIQSCNLEDAPASVKIIFKGLRKYSDFKSYLRPVCFHGISELVQKVPNSIFDKVLWHQISELLGKGWGTCDAELFDVLQSCCKYHPDTCGKAFLKAHNWIGQKSKKVELIGLHSYKYLGKMFPLTTACHPRIHPLCYEVVESVIKSDNETFRKFWKEVVETDLLESSPERKYLAFKLAIYTLPLLKDEQIKTVWSNRIVTAIFYLLSNKTNPLHIVCKTEIVNDLSDKMRSEKMTPEKQLTLFFQLLTSPAGLFLDENTNTRFVHTISGSLKLEAVQKYVEWLKNVFITGKLNHEGIKEVSLDTARRWSMLQISQLIRNSRLPREDTWLTDSIKFLFLHYHFLPKTCAGTKFPELAGIDESFVPITQKTRENLKHCLEPALNAMNSIPSLQKSDDKEALRPRFNGSASDGEFWVHKLINFANKLTSDSDVKLVRPMDDEQKEFWAKMIVKIEQIRTVEESDSSRISEGTALRLLLAHIGIRLLNSTKEEGSTAQEVLSDLFQVVDERFDRDVELDSGHQESCDEVNWVEVIIETILSMLSQNSSCIRSVADQVFKLLSTQLTRKGLQLILDVLDPARKKDVLHTDEEQMEEVENEEEETEECEAESSDSDDSAFKEEDVSDGNNEDNQFRKKVKEALGEAAGESSEEEDGVKVEEEEDSDSGPEMDDDAMMRLDSVLAEVFRQKKMTKKKMMEDSHKQLLIFQLRCLDLVEIMANRRYAQDPHVTTDSDCLVLEVVRPLLVAIQHSSGKSTDMILAEKASVLLKVKICKMKRYPKNLPQETITRCHDDIELMMAVAYKAQSVFMCQLASDCCLFLLRVLCGNTPQDSDQSPTGVIDVPRVQKVYKAALENFMTHRESHLQPCVMQDFISRFPILAADLAQDLLKYLKDGVQIYRRSRACSMLHELMKNPASRDKCKSLLFQVVSVTNEMVERAAASGQIKTKYFAELMRLYHQTITVLHSTDKLKSLNKSTLTTPLEKFLELPQVTKSQELTSWTWKVLHGLGVERNPTKENKKKAKKRKKADSESEKNDGAVSEKSAMEPKTEAPSAETSKELKARVRKEKKERSKGFKKKVEEKSMKTGGKKKSEKDRAKKLAKKKEKKEKDKSGKEVETQN